MSAEEDKLVKRIRDVFDAHTDGSADAGWAELRKKYPEKNRRPLVFWLTTAATIMLFATAIWYFAPVAPAVKKNVVDNSTRIDSRGLSKREAVGTDKKERMNNGKEESLDRNEGRPPDSNSTSAPGATIAAKNANAQSSRPTKTVVLSRVRSDKNAATPPAIAPQVHAGNNAKSPDSPVSVAVTNNAAAVPATKSDSVQAKAANPVLIPKKPVSADTSQEKRLKDNRKFPLSFYMSGYMSYARGSNAHFNAGAGVTYGIPLSKNLKIRTGAAILQTDLVFTNGVLPVSPSGVAFDALYARPSTLPGGVTASSATSIDVKLVSIDIPVNLVYTFQKSRNGMFIAAGTSSSLFLNETYTYNRLAINSSNNGTALNALNVTTERFSDGAGKFNFARTINLSAGIGFPIGLKERLFFEPFVKLPVAGLGSRHIFYGSAGLNLRLDLSDGGMGMNGKR